MSEKLDTYAFGVVLCEVLTREAAALRLNLKRRKAQTRARADQPAEEPEDSC